MGSFEDVASEIVEELEGNLERVEQLYIRTIREAEVKGEIRYGKEKRRADNLQAECGRVEELRDAADQVRALDPGILSIHGWSLASVVIREVVEPTLDDGH